MAHNENAKNHVAHAGQKEQDTPMQERNLNENKSDKPKCSGTFCPFNRNYDASECNLAGNCDYYMPVADMSGMEAVIDMAIKQFCIDESGREKLRILFNAYVAEYMRVFCRL